MGVDAIQEFFSVLTTNYSAEYGKTSGGGRQCHHHVSGTNPFTAAAYEICFATALWMPGIF